MSKTELLIDTNVLYYLSGISINKTIDIQKLRNELSNYELLVSEWTLIEIITKSEFSDHQKELVLKYIFNNNIKRIRFQSIIDLSFIPSNLADIIDDQYKEFISNKSLVVKKECEIEFITRYINSVVTIFLLALYFNIENDNNNDSSYFLSLTQFFLLNNDDFIKSKVVEYIEKYNIDKKESEFRKEIDAFIYTLLYAFLIIYSDKKLVYNKIFSGIEKVLPGEENENFQTPSIPLNIIDLLQKKIISFNIRGIAKKVGISNLEKALSLYETVVSENMIVGIFKFILTSIRNLLYEGTKLNKNDMVDAMLLHYYPNLQLLTFDKRLKKIIKDFDKEYYNFIVSIENKCKK